MTDPVSEHYDGGPAMSLGDEKPLKQVWCVAYDDPTPHMDGVRTTRMQETDDPMQAARMLSLLKRRSVKAPKRNLRLQSRMVTDWADWKFGDHR